MTIQNKSLRIVKALTPNSSRSIESLAMELGISTTKFEESKIAYTLKYNGLVNVNYDDDVTIISLTDEGEQVIPFI
ncbi:hypothetical protein [Flammeovirga kamogawensis]|uniref:Uncharacterized protein n=1 Tax=Flammeovirga kamogawensis TaxID=373891 RepID=A0ABX8H1C1_9BACT|nr:hypothetical protein [Flammeovirga kamogawensis]MBB6462559.1 hypothetical protein [Flammeovirga kamogawensis]QWG09691.1 hypothetical protein KM029_24110 [Flammeovirga kamogawensis]TRX65203.1 hypothetical protein EO216_22005 [Flammeovirga kamogawensis]